MPGYFKGIGQKAGLPPGTLMPVGMERTADINITVMHYDAAHYTEHAVTAVEDCFAQRDATGVTWIDVAGVSSIDNLKKLGACLGLHLLVLEDIINVHQRPKVEDFGDYVFLVFKRLAFQSREGGITAGQISIILSADRVVTFSLPGDGATEIFNPIRERLRSGVGNLRKRGADYLAYALMDAIVDDYFTVLEKVGDDIEFLEEDLVRSPTADMLQEIHRLKKDMTILRKSLWPLREVVGRLDKKETTVFQDSTIIYLRDVYDHIVQVIDMVETLRDIISGMLDIYLSSISIKLNEVMKVLTIIATIFIPLTFIVGVYGMNFQYMPELTWPWGYPAVWLVMLATAAAMLAFFRRKKWL